MYTFNVLRSVVIISNRKSFKLSVSNPKSKYVAYLSVLSRVSNCQGLGRKNKHTILKTDRTGPARSRRRRWWCPDSKHNATSNNKDMILIVTITIEFAYTDT